MYTVMKTSSPFPLFITSSPSDILEVLEAAERKGLEPIMMFSKCRSFKPQVLDVYLISSDLPLTQEEIDKIERMGRESERVVDIN